MSPKKRTIIEKSPDNTHPDRVIVEEQIDPKDQPNVLAYRLGKLEEVVAKGFEEQKQRLDDFIKNFVTQQQLLDERNAAAEEHKQLWGALKDQKQEFKDFKKNIRWWVGIGVGVATLIAIVIQTFHKP